MGEQLSQLLRNTDAEASAWQSSGEYIGADAQVGKATIGGIEGDGLNFWNNALDNKNDIRRLRGELRSLRVLLKEHLEEHRAAAPTDQEPEVINLRELDHAEAKKEILDLFASQQGALYYGDVADILKLDLEQVVELCNRLVSEGRLRIDDRS